VLREFDARAVTDGAVTDRDDDIAVAHHVTHPVMP
jgi:hypothetical protein